MRTVAISDWIQCGEGGYSRVYVNPDLPDVVLKLNDACFPESSAQMEFDAADKVQSLRLPSPDVYEVVTDGAGRYGILMEKLHDKKSFARIVADEPYRADEIACRFASLARTLLSTPSDTSVFESVPDRMQRVIMACDAYSPRIKDKICSIISGIDKTTTCLHGDLHFGNVVECSKGDMWIDCGEFGYGHPVFDLSQPLMLSEKYDDNKAQREFHMSAACHKEFYSLFEKHFYGRLSDAAKEDIRNRLRRMFLVKYSYYGALDNKMTDRLVSALEKLIGQ